MKTELARTAQLRLIVVCMASTVTHIGQKCCKMTSIILSILWGYIRMMRADLHFMSSLSGIVLCVCVLTMSILVYCIQLCAVVYVKCIKPAREGEVHSI